MELIPKQFTEVNDIVSFIVSKLEYLVTARPTAVNMTDSAKWFTARAKDYANQPNITVKDIKNR